jgi:Fe-S-cluster containining protein
MGRKSRAKQAHRAVKARGAAPEDLSALVDRLARGEAGPEVTADQACAIAEALTEELEEGTRMRAEVARARGMTIACGVGCAACCEEPVLVYLPEAHRIARFLARPDSRAAREAFVSGHARWRAGLGDAPERLAELAVRDADRDAYEALHRATWRRGVACAFLVDGACSVYPARPLVCRNAHAIETSERCSGKSLVPATRLTFGPVDDFLGRAAFLLRQAHDRMEGARAGRSEALPDLVKGLLDQGERGERG